MSYANSNPIQVLLHQHLPVITRSLGRIADALEKEGGDKVFILFEDKSIVGIFGTRKAALGACAPKHKHYRIEEHEVK